MDPQTFQTLMQKITEQNTLQFQAVLERMLNAQSDVHARNLNTMNTIVEKVSERLQGNELARKGTGGFRQEHHPETSVLAPSDILRETRGI